MKKVGVILELGHTPISNQLLCGFSAAVESELQLFCQQKKKDNKVEFKIFTKSEEGGEEEEVEGEEVSQVN